MLDIPEEILLHIFSYLDLPDLASLSRISPTLANLTADPILHKQRLCVTTPSRVDHSLFGKGPLGDLLRPTVGELVHRGVMRGLGIERKWRMGLYFYSPNCVQLYERGVHLERRHASNVVSSNLRRRKPIPVYLVDETLSGSVSRTLLPVIHKLKWCLRRDQLAKVVRGDKVGHGLYVNGGGFGQWIELAGGGIMQDSSERVRLALCPGVRKFVRFYEGLAARKDNTATIVRQIPSA